MFMFHAALALNLLALCAGAALFIFGASRCDTKGACFAKLVAVIVIILATLSTLCTMNTGRIMWANAQDGQGMMGGQSCAMCDVKQNADKPSTPERAAMPEKPVKNARHR